MGRDNAFYSHNALPGWLESLAKPSGTAGGDICAQTLENRLLDRIASGSLSGRYAPERTRQVEKAEMGSNFFYHPSWPVLYEDNHLLGLYKPAGLLVQGDRTGEESLLELARAWLKDRYAKPGNVFLGMIHRLDRPVAGVVLFCRTSKAAGRLSLQFRAKTVRKTYLAVLEGKIRQASGRVVHHLERIEGRSTRVLNTPTPGSREAVLSFSLLDYDPERRLSLIEVDLETGRHHQIRAQFAHLGHPVAGDLRYGASAALPQKQIALLARELAVDHPVSKERIRILSPLPRSWPWLASFHPDSPAPPWNWTELRPLLSPWLHPPGSCPFPETVKE